MTRVIGVECWEGFATWGEVLVMSWSVDHNIASLILGLPLGAGMISSTESAEKNIRCWIFFSEAMVRYQVTKIGKLPAFTVDRERGAGRRSGGDVEGLLGESVYVATIGRVTQD